MVVRWIKALLLVLYLAGDYRAIGERIHLLDTPVMFAAYFTLYGVLAVALLAAACIPNTLARISGAVILAGASLMLQGYEWTTHAPLDYNGFETMLASSGDLHTAIGQYGAQLVMALLSAAVLFTAIALPPRGIALPFKLHWQLPVAAVVGLAVMLYMRGGEGSRGLPAPFVPLAHAGIMTSLAMLEDGGPRKAVSFQPRKHPDAHDIILIVDESVAANYLDINHSAGVYSGLLSPREGWSIVNYGVAASVTNCSIGSNKTLRFGGTRETYRMTGQSYPSIWAYAHAAGYRTVYLDGQRNHGELQNLATQEERAEIDDFVQLDGVSVVERDQTLARMIAARISNGKPEFLYVNKVGAHFPVADKFPEAVAKFHPLPQRGLTASIVDMGPAHGAHKGTAGEWRLYRNAYRNTVIWNVGHFFDTLLEGVKPGSATIIYTSDHGQDLHERGQPGKATHCINDPAPEEGAVPLVVLDSAAHPALDWQAHRTGNHNGMSHFRIFPTLLQIMGYAKPDVAQLYGASLADADPDPMTFTINYFARLGREPTWRKVEPARLASPPSSDFSSPGQRMPR